MKIKIDSINESVQKGKLIVKEAEKYELEEEKDSDDELFN